MMPEVVGPVWPRGGKWNSELVNGNLAAAPVLPLLVGSVASVAAVDVERGHADDGGDDAGNHCA